MESEFQAVVDGDIIRIAIRRSRVDAASAGVFKEVVSSTWQPTLKHAVIDMSQVEFVDSSGVGALLGVLRRLPQGEGSVVLKAMRPQVLSVIELLRLHRVFQIEE